MRCGVRLLGLWLVLGQFAGCAPAKGPEVLTVSAAEYQQAFDTALDVSRREGMPAALRDRRGGVIETDPRIAGSVIEPWRTDNASFGQAVENTVNFQRRRARFEFARVGFNPQQQPPPTQPQSTPPQSTQPQSIQPPATQPIADVVGTNQPEIDLTNDPGPFELRVWVYVERAHTFGVRRSTWSRSKTSVSHIIVPEGEAPVPAGAVWTPVERDEAYERRLLAMIQDRLHQTQ